MSEQPPKILVIDDVPENVRLLEAVLVPRAGRRRRHRTRLRDLRGGRLRGPLRLRRDRGGDEPPRTARRGSLGGQVLIAQGLFAEVEQDVDVVRVGEFTLKGLGRPVTAFDVVAVRSAAPEPSRR